MKISFIKKQLVNGIDNINIPQKEQLLPAAAFEKSTNRKPRIYYKKIATAAAALVVIVSVILGVNSINFNSVTPTPNENKIVISGEINDIPIENDMDSIVLGGDDYRFPVWDFVIHDKLKEKMDEYKNPDVWFRVLVKVDITDAPKYEVSKQAQDEIDKILEEAEKIKTEMDSITWNLYTTPEDVIRERMEKQKDLSAKLQKLYGKITEIEQADRANFQNEQIQKKLDIARNLGALNIINAKESSDCYFLTSTHIMEVTADMINQLVDSGYFKFALAPPARLDGYSDKISDSLTVKLSTMGDTDTIEVVVVAVADNYNSFAVSQKIPANRDYNSKYNKTLTKPKDYIGYTIDLINLTNDYIDDIVNRNGLATKRVAKENLPKLSPEIYVGKKEFYAVAGFNAVLTKAEILSLANDPDVKVIYLTKNEDFTSNDVTYFDSEFVIDD